MMRWRGLLPLAVMAVVAACASVRNPVSGELEHTVMDEQSELREGQKAHQEVLREYRVLAHPVVQEYVRAVGLKLARASHRAHLDWKFTVLDSPEVNAFALPGGYIYITRGLLAYLNDEAELAGVLGHEIGHVTARHAAQRATRQQVAGVGVLLANILGAALEGRGLSGAADFSSQTAQLAAAGYLAAYSREQESQADRLGADYLARNHYAPARMVDVIRALQAQERFAADQAREEGRPPPRSGGWLATHPSNDQRLRDIEQVARPAAGATAVAANEGRERYLAAIEGIPFGESSEDGLTRGRHFFHGPLGFALTAPPGWRLQNGSEALLIAERRGEAAVVLRPVPAQAGENPEEVLRNLLQLPSGRITAVTINGFAAAAFSGSVRSAQGMREVDATVIRGPARRHYLFLHVARDMPALGRWRETMRTVEQSFRALSDAERREARPWRIRSVTLPKGGLAELARHAPAALERPEAQLRLLNGVYPSGELAPGTRVKVVAE